jgi:hypothetical protein
MLADLPLAEDDGDLLGFKSFADAIAGVIDSPRTATPFVLAINAEWGAGKTTLGKMVERRLREKPAADGNRPHTTCWFNAWMHDESSSLATSLAAEVARQANRYRPAWLRVIRPLPSSLIDSNTLRVRRGLKYLFLILLPLSAFAIVSYRFGFRLRDVIKSDVPLAGSISSFVAETYKTTFPLTTALVIGGVLLFHAAKLLLPIAKSVGEFVRDPQSAAKSASMTEVRRQLHALIRGATPRGSKFVIFIDDLDRCRPPRLIDLFEVVNQLLDHPSVVTVMMADMQVVAKSAEITYESLLKPAHKPQSEASREGQSTYGWDYVQKVIQLQFDLPRHSAEKMKALVSTLAKRVPKDDKLTRIQTLLEWLKNTVQKVMLEVRNLIDMRAAGSPSYLFVALGLAIVAGTWLILSPPISHRLRVTAVALVIFNVSALVALLLAQLIRNISVARRRRKIDEQIDKQIAAGGKDFSSVSKALQRINRDWQRDAYSQGLLRERLQRYLEDESELQIEAEDEVLKYLEPLPRHAKRVLNRLRLLLFVAHERRMFGGQPKLTPRHIGKWAVLCERWPGLAEIIYREPHLMAMLEDTNHQKGLLKGRLQAYQGEREFPFFFLDVKGIHLADLIERIVEFRPADK